MAAQYYSYGKTTKYQQNGISINFDLKNILHINNYNMHIILLRLFAHKNVFQTQGKYSATAETSKHYSYG
jgi:hypothetical protein